MTATTDSAVRIEDVQGVRSRVSWSAIIGGAVIAIATYLVLTFFFAALGHVADRGRGAENAVGIGAIVAAVLTIVVSLFFGGWVTTQLTVGETRCEAMIYGLLTWAVVTASRSACRHGHAGRVLRRGQRHDGRPEPAHDGGELGAPPGPAGASEQSIANMKASMDPSRVQAAANDPANRERRGKERWSRRGRPSPAPCCRSWRASAAALAGRGATFRLLPVATVRPTPAASSCRDRCASGYTRGTPQAHGFDVRSRHRPVSTNCDGRRAISSIPPSGSP